MATRTVLVMAKHIARRLEADYLDYLESCESYRKDGYRPHYCEHGTNLWTDYDNICGGCEDGVTMGDPMQRREYALDSAKRRHEEVTAIVQAVKVLTDNVPRFEVPASVWDEVNRLLTP